MAITLAEAKVGMADKVDQQIVDMFRRSSLLLDQMVFDNVISPGTGGSTLTYGYIQLKSPSTASVRTVGGEYVPGEAKKEKKTANAIIMGGAFQMDRVIQNTAGAANEMAFQAEQKIKATANYFHNLVINGSGDATGEGYVNGTFDGLKKLGVVLKRAKYFILCKGRAAPGIVMTHQAILRALLSDAALESMHRGEQLSLFDPTMEDVKQCLTGQI